MSEYQKSSLIALFLIVSPFLAIVAVVLLL